MTCAYMAQLEDVEERGNPFWANVGVFEEQGDALRRAAGISLERGAKARVIQLSDNGVRWDITGTKEIR